MLEETRYEVTWHDDQGLLVCTLHSKWHVTSSLPNLAHAFILAGGLGKYLSPLSMYNVQLIARGWSRMVDSFCFRFDTAVLPDIASLLVVFGLAQSRLQWSHLCFLDIHLVNPIHSISEKVLKEWCIQAISLPNPCLDMDCRQRSHR